MKLSTDRILTTHVGSLPRPQAIVDLLAARVRGDSSDPAAYDVAMREATAAIVARQAALGVDVVSDGEMSKASYATYIQERLSGWGPDSEPQPIARDMLEHPELLKQREMMRGARLGRRMCCTAPLAIKDRAPLRRDIANFRAALEAAPAVEAFMNSISPGTAAAFQRNAYYPTHEKYIEALAGVMKEEYRAIVDAGFLLQLDCPDLAGGSWYQHLSDAEFLNKNELHVAAINAALEGVPPEKVRIHVCWGNYEGPHDYDRPLEKLAAIILKTRAQGLSLEGANPRHEHEWIVWRDTIKLPDDKILITGVLDTRTNYVEHPELVAQRINRYARTVGKERVIASSDCGFATFAGSGKLDPGVSFKKLRALVEGAEISSKRLWKKR